MYIVCQKRERKKRGTGARHSAVSSFVHSYQQQTNRHIASIFQSDRHVYVSTKICFYEWNALFTSLFNCCHVYCTAYIVDCRKVKSSAFLAPWSTRSCRTLRKMWRPSVMLWRRWLAAYSLIHMNTLCTRSLLRAYVYLIVFLFQATIDIYNAIIAKMLPTPTKIHYLFNLRDISRVGTSIYQGLKNRETFQLFLCEFIPWGLGYPTISCMAYNAGYGLIMAVKSTIYVHFYLIVYFIGFSRQYLHSILCS